MAQSQFASPSLGGVDASALWESPGSIGEPPLDIWSLLATPPATQPSIVTAPVVIPAPDRTDIPHVLAAWRAAERQLDEHIEASPMRSAVQAEIARLRAKYHRLFDQAAK